MIIHSTGREIKSLQAQIFQCKNTVLKNYLRTLARKLGIFCPWYTGRHQKNVKRQACRTSDKKEVLCILYKIYSVQWKNSKDSFCVNEKHFQMRPVHNEQMILSAVLLGTARTS